MAQDIVVTPRGVTQEVVSTEKIKIDLDERSFIMPMGKVLTHLLISLVPPRTICLEAVFAFNNARDGNCIATLTLEEAKAFTAELLLAVYSARAQTAILDTLNVTINVLANGYQIEFVRHDSRLTFYISTGPIWRFIKALLQILDGASPSTTN